MNILDYILIAVLILFAVRCFWLGFIKSFGSLIGLIIGSVVASYAYLKLFELIKFIFGGYDNLGKVVCFFLLFAVFSKLVYFIFVALDKAYDFLSIIPFLGPINNLAGAILGLLIGILFCGLAVYVMGRYFPVNETFGGWLKASLLAHYLSLIIKLLLPILSESLKSLKTFIE
jgi:uncharacterized membrane protein required for colicin V production